MAGFMGIDNSIGWAHWQLKGGWRNTITTISGYLVLLIAVVSLSMRATLPERMSETLSVWRNILMVLQVGILVLFGAGRIGSAIRADLVSRMYESHRLMPIPAAGVISGYLWGPTLQPLILAGVNFVAGLIITVASGMGADVWIMPNIVLCSFALFAWVLGAFAGFLGKNAGAIIFAPLLGAGIFQNFPFLILPGLTVLISPIAGKTIFTATVAFTVPGGGWGFGLPQILAVVAQICVGSIFYRGAIRKYLRPEETALGVLPALLLLVAWVGISMLGLVMWDDYRPRFIFQDDIRMSCVSSLVAAMLLSLAAIANSARDRRIAPWSPLLALLSAAVTLVMTTAFIGAVTRRLLADLQPAMADNPAAAVAQTGLVLGAFALSMCFVLRILYRFVSIAWFYAAIWMVITWAGPHMIDYAAWASKETVDEFVMTRISAASPIGALLMIWSDHGGAAINGAILFQWIVAMIVAAVFYGTRKRRQNWTSNDLLNQAESPAR